MSDAAPVVKPTIPPADVAAVQAQQAALLAAAQKNDATNAAFLSEVVQLVKANEEQSLAPQTPSSIGDPSSSIGDTASDASSDVSANNSLLNLNTPSLSLFSEIITNSSNDNINGNLTAQQIHDLNILQQDMQGLQNASNLGNTIALVPNETTVDLSIEAQLIANETTTQNTAASTTTAAPATVLPTPIPIPLAVSPTITPAQLAQIGTILTPLANQPLTPALVTSIQAQLTATGISPLQLSLQTLMLVMNYIVGIPSAQLSLMKTNKPINTENNDITKVSAVSAIDRAAVEDSAIHSK